MTAHTRSRKGQEGIALLIVLLFVAILMALVIEFTYETQVETSQVSANVNDFDALIAAKSGVASGMSLLIQDLILGVTGQQNDTKKDSGSESERQGAELYDSLDEVWALGTPFQKINNGVMQCSIEDEFGKLNLNALFNSRAQEPREDVVEILRRLIEARQGDPSVVDAIIDWLDEDDDPQPMGAESDYYQQMPVPYRAKNGPMSSVEELLLVRGITPELFFGNGTVDQLPLTELLTVYGHRSGRVNANTAQHELLVAVGEAIGQPGIADIILEERETAPFMSMSDLETRGIQQPREEEGQVQFRPFVIASSAFRIQGNGMSGRSKVRIEAFVRRDTQGGPDGFRILDWREVR
ncbi:MAG: type II secretion system minor pseudopilin GspK [Candidatus Hydrogenedentes bacterium]|nr:type II secretion system minor pseudopilin GspK [Candidatus Hydrogenedentota bacterium]